MSYNVLVGGRVHHERTKFRHISTSGRVHCRDVWLWFRQHGNEQVHESRACLAETKTPLRVQSTVTDTMRCASVG